MNTAATFKQIDVTRAIKAVVGAGQSVREVEITRDGAIRIIVNNEKRLEKGPEPEL